MCDGLLLHFIWLKLLHYWTCRLLFTIFFFFLRCSTNWSGTQCERPAPKSSKSDHISTSKFLRLVSWVFYMVQKYIFSFYAIIEGVESGKISFMEFCKRSTAMTVFFERWTSVHSVHSPGNKIQLYVLF